MSADTPNIEGKTSLAMQSNFHLHLWQSYYQIAGDEKRADELLAHALDVLTRNPLPTIDLVQHLETLRKGRHVYQSFVDYSKTVSESNIEIGKALERARLNIPAGHESGETYFPESFVSEIERLGKDLRFERAALKNTRRVFFELLDLMQTVYWRASRELGNQTATCPCCKATTDRRWSISDTHAPGCPVPELEAFLTPRIVSQIDSTSKHNPETRFWVNRLNRSRRELKWVLSQARAQVESLSQSLERLRAKHTNLAKEQIKLLSRNKELKEHNDLLILALKNALPFVEALWQISGKGVKEAFAIELGKLAIEYDDVIKPSTDATAQGESTE